MEAWSIEFPKFDLQYKPHGPMKTQFMADILAEFAGHVQATPDWWNLYVDGTSNVKGSRVGIILEGPNNITLEQALQFEFKGSNNQVEYKALIVDLKLAKEVGAMKLMCCNDSQLVQSDNQHS